MRELKTFFVWRDSRYNYSCADLEELKENYELIYDLYNANTYEEKETISYYIDFEYPDIDVLVAVKTKATKENLESFVNEILGRNIEHILYEYGEVTQILPLKGARKW